LNIEHGDLNDRHGADAAKAGEGKVEASIGPSGPQSVGWEGLCTNRSLGTRERASR